MGATLSTRTDATTDQLATLERYRRATKAITCPKDAFDYVEVGPRRLVAKITVDEGALNLRGYAHGGWLYTLCDAASGALLFSQGLDCVTQQGSISYLSAGRLDDSLRVVVTNQHWGRTTVVNLVRIEHDDEAPAGEGKPVAVATMNMFVVGTDVEGIIAPPEA